MKIAERDELLRIKQAMLEMGEKAVVAVKLSISALVTNNTLTAAKVRDIEKEVDAYYQSIDEQCISALSKQPDEESLRFLVGSLKIAIEIERSCDYANQIAKRVQKEFSQQDMTALRSQVQSITHMVQEAVTMLENALVAYEHGDDDAADRLHAQDDLVDKKTHDLFRSLLCVASLNPWIQEVVLDLHVVVRYVERVADRSANVAELVYYIVRGTRFCKTNKTL
ncbi:phosphate transport system protein [Sporomusaceae bacterium BoRhaA]|uniref:phosphate signaling complex protein PhoU n=1 Tax=Pelorhabdus rhamnosifermentans TaxID=2772457 RepID=UPI001C0637A7|nr:phosphate signaling complex protein PhoU [Pelorhabdus rhamnosifermentans]MBU2701900.1 phosphate transport system protein [Pelorhabdus rhamnosifermentans]